MHVLIVTAFESVSRNKLKRVDTQILLEKTIKKAFGESRRLFPCSNLNVSSEDNNTYIFRNCDELSDLVVDWSYEKMDDIAHNKLRAFDKIDVVIVAGDMKGVLPWDPRAMQAVTLMHMIQNSKKPLLAIGFGAFLSIYALSTQGGKFHMLNGPGGDMKPRENLPIFPHFAPSSGQYPSGWLDHSTGDIYCYIEDRRCWQPHCNIGIHRYPLAIEPYSPRSASAGVRKVEHEFDFNFNFKYPRTTTAATAVALDEQVVCIRKQNLQHPLLKGVTQVAQNCNSLPNPHFSPRPPSAPLTFLLRTYSFWFLNSERSLPVNDGLQVLAECERGPVILAKDNSLLLAMELEPSRSCYPIASHLISNFITQTVINLIPQQANRYFTPSVSLYEMLLGTDGSGRGASYDSAKHLKPRAAPSVPSSTCIYTVLPSGPLQVDPPSPALYEKPVPVFKIDYFALTRDRKHSSLGKEPRLVVQKNPLSSRSSRLQHLFHSAGFGGEKGLSFVQDSLSSSELSCEQSLFLMMPSDCRNLEQVILAHSLASPRRSKAASKQLNKRNVNMNVGNTGNKQTLPDASKDSRIGDFDSSIVGKEGGDLNAALLSRSPLVPLAEGPEEEEDEEGQEGLHPLSRNLPPTGSIASSVSPLASILEEVRSVTPFAESSVSATGLGAGEGLGLGGTVTSHELSSESNVAFESTSNIIIQDVISATAGNNNSNEEEDDFVDETNLSMWKSSSIVNSVRPYRRLVIEEKEASSAPARAPAPPTYPQRSKVPMKKVDISGLIAKDGKAGLSRLLHSAATDRHLPLHHPPVATIGPKAPATMGKVRNVRDVFLRRPESHTFSPFYGISS